MSTEDFIADALAFFESPETIESLERQRAELAAVVAARPIPLRLNQPRRQPVRRPIANRRPNPRTTRLEGALARRRRVPGPRIPIQRVAVAKPTPARALKRPPCLTARRRLSPVRAHGARRVSRRPSCSISRRQARAPSRSSEGPAEPAGPARRLIGGVR